MQRRKNLEIIMAQLQRILNHEFSVDDPQILLLVDRILTIIKREAQAIQAQRRAVSR